MTQSSTQAKETVTTDRAAGREKSRYLQWRVTGCEDRMLILSKVGREERAVEGTERVK